MNYSLNAAELSSALSALPSGGFSPEVNHSKGMQNTIAAFASSQLLTGESWDAVKAGLGQFSDALQKRMELATELYGAINTALKVLINFMGEYDKLDASQQAEIEETLQRCETNLESCRACIESGKYTDVENEDGSVKQVWTYTYSYAQRKRFAELIVAYEAEIEELKKILKKLEELPEVYERAMGILEQAFSKVDEFSSVVGGITVHTVDV